MRALVLSLFGLVACSGSVDAESEPRAEPSAGDEARPPPVASSDAPAAMQELLAAHNARRAEHCAPPLAWSAEIAQHAQSWANVLGTRGCALQHSQSGLGENLAGGTSGALSGASVTDMWYRESSEFDYRRGGFSMDTGHFTQLVWIGTRSIGCGIAQCDGLDIWVCNYDPPGNVDGEYRANVRPTSCR